MFYPSWALLVVVSGILRMPRDPSSSGDMILVEASMAACRRFMSRELPQHDTARFELMENFLRQLRGLLDSSREMLG